MDRLHLGSLVALLCCSHFIHSSKLKICVFNLINTKLKQKSGASLFLFCLRKIVLLCILFQNLKILEGTKSVNKYEKVENNIGGSKK